MRVRLTYTVELEEMFEEVKRLLNKCTAELSEKNQNLEDQSKALSEDNVSKVLESIKLLREEMMKKDLLLEECHEILRSFEDYKRRMAQGGEDEKPTL
jgi:Skp family chaperone for outer membrane proteins